MPEYQFQSSISIRYYGQISVNAPYLDAAKALLIDPTFDMKKAFEPNGAGDDDFSFNIGKYDVYVESVFDEDADNDIALNQSILTSAERARESADDIYSAAKALLVSADLSAQAMDDLKLEGRSCSPRPPTGDDWNELFSQLDGLRSTIAKAEGGQ